MTNTLTMSALYEKLKDFGISTTYVKENGLPSWWDEELNNKPVAVLECSGYIANRFGLDLKSLLSKDKTIQFSGLTQTKFKQRANNQKSDIAHGLAHRLAEIIAYGCEIDFTPLPRNADEIRQEILQTHSTINLSSLVDYCWEKGIAVAHFNQFPKDKTKFDGMIQWHNQRPVIIISVNYKESPRLAFILAHELGHLALGHITEGDLFDDEIKFKTDDREEQEANQFAVKLLLDDCDNCFGDKEFHNKDHLIKKAEAIASENPTIDIGSIILNNAWHNDNWGFANKALQKLYPEDDGQKFINEYLANKLDWDVFDDDSYEYLEQVLGV